jgi:hypothetical protein
MPRPYEAACCQILWERSLAHSSRPFLGESIGCRGVRRAVFGSGIIMSILFGIRQTMNVLLPISR